MALFLCWETNMNATDFRLETAPPPPEEPPDREEEPPRREEPDEEPGYGHGV